MAASDGVAKAIAMKDDLLLKIEKLGEHLPPNTLDELIDSLGGSDAVAEVRTVTLAINLKKFITMFLIASLDDHLWLCCVYR